MGYITVEELRQKPYLDQIGDADVGALQTMINGVSTDIANYLGYEFDTAAVGTEVVYGNGTDYLRPPAFVAGSVTAVTAPTGYTVPDYVEVNGYLVVTYSGILGPSYGRTVLYGGRADPYGGWQNGVPYTVAATFGYEEVPDDIKLATAIQTTSLFGAAQGGFTGIVGLEGAGVTRQAALHPLVKQILDRRKASSGLGVW